MGLRRVLNHQKFMASRNFENRVHVGALSVEMHQQNGAGARGDGGFDFCCINIERGGVDIHVNRCRAHIADGGDSGVKGEGNGDHLIARLNAGGQQSQVQRAGSRN